MLRLQGISKEPPVAKANGIIGTQGKIKVVPPNRCHLHWLWLAVNDSRSFNIIPQFNIIELLNIISLIYINS